MDLFENFVELFLKWKKEKSDFNLTTVLKNGPSYFKNVSTNDIDLALSIFLNDKTGLLNFLANAHDKSIESSIVEGFKLLNFIIQQFYWLLNKYLNKIKEVCQFAMITRCSHKVKTAAVDCFENFVKMCPRHELGLSEIVTLFVGKFHLCRVTERIKLFNCLGIIAKYYPEAIASARSRKIFETVMNDFDECQSKSKNSQSNELATYIEVLNVLLVNFSPNECYENCQKYYNKLYGYIKGLSDIDVDQKFKFVSRAAVELLGKHMSLFDKYVYEDATFWHIILLKWKSLAGDNGSVGFKTLSIYYERMGVMLKTENTKSSRKIFENLKRFLENELTNENVDSTALRLSICGFGHMAGPCKFYSTEIDIEKMFTILAQRATITYTNNNDTDKVLIENIAYYQLALSQIIFEMLNISRDKLDTLIKLSLTLVKRFPDLPKTDYHHSWAVTSLIKTIINIRKACRRSSDELIQKLVYEGIAWSCSHTLFVDAEREREINNLDERPICYVNYLPLWQKLIKQNKIGDAESSGISKDIFNNMIETCIKLIKKLNLDVKNVDVSSEIESESFDIQLAVNDTDLRVFINLVDLFSSILKEVEPVLIRPNLNRFICEIIKKSYENPLISGFYKLINVVLKLCETTFDSRGEKLSDETLKLIPQYLSDTIERLSSFSGELQSACFNMIFEIPVFIARKVLGSLSTVFKTAFSLGQSNFGLALSAMSTLEKLAATMDKEEMTNFFVEVIPRLEPFLQSDESAVELANEILPKERTAKKNIFLIDSEKTLPEFQKRILLLFGSLNSDVILNIAGGQNFDNETLIDNKYSLKYTLLYRDVKPDIYLDTILTRTVELALHSTDRRTRVVACEVLHSIIIVVLARTMQFLSSDPDHMLPVFKKICPAVLRLGSDSDPVIQQLFCPLMIQMTHWYSSKMMLRSSETVYLIDALFELLTYESNMALTDFCGVCLAEFVKWSIKQSTDVELQTPFTNIKIILSKIKYFSTHPSVRKRIGAAVAFNYLYTILREYDIIIDTYWLELFYCFVKSLDNCNSPEILKSLKHVERVIQIKSKLLNRSSSSRVKPTEFKGALLKDAAVWLVAQCGSLDRNYRLKSMELLAAISKSIPEFGTIEKFFSDYVKSNGMRGLNEVILKGLYPKMGTLGVETMNPLLRTLDCYIWILNENIIGLDSIFTDKNTNKDMIFNCVINFVYLVNVKREKSEESSKFTKQYRMLSSLKCEIILKIFDFVRILLDKMDTEIGPNSPLYIPTFFWNEELYSLISAAVFKPDVIGFDSKNLELIKSLPSSIQRLLLTLIKKLNDERISQLKDSIAKEVRSKYEQFSDLSTILISDTSVTLNNYLKGLIMLENCDEFVKLYERPINDDASIEKVMEIYNSLKREQYRKAESTDLESDVKEYLENLLEFLYLRFNPKMVITLVDIVHTKPELTQENSTVISHGEYFMKLFGHPIYRNMLKHISKSLDTLLDNSLKTKFDTVLIILEDLLVYVKNDRKISEEFLSSLEIEFVHRFLTFSRLINCDEKRKDKLINIYSLLVQVSKNPFQICCEPNELYSWIMQELLSYLCLEYKTRILNNFLPCIVGENEHKKRELTRCFERLKSDFYSVNINDLAKGSLEHSNRIASFQTLAHRLPSLKSVVFFDCLIRMTIGNVKYLWDSNTTKYLNLYFNGITNASSKESLQVLYKYFMDAEEFKTKLEILKNLLLECIHFCNGNAIEQFYEENIKEIYDIVSKDITGNSSDLKNLIVLKIGCYNLLEVMVAKVSLEKICSADSKIVKNSIGTIRTRNELFQALNCNTLAVRTLKNHSNDDESKELMRLLHCAAYNCSIAIVSLKTEECFYVLPFGENRAKGQLIWENIIDANKKYRFEQDFKETPKEYKKLINIRKQCNLTKAHNYSYLKSYDLAASTLNEDLSRFDLYESNLEAQPIAENNDKEEMMTLTFELDDINNHECMAPICGVIMHMVLRDISRLPDDGESLPMPKWMVFLRNSFNSATIYNVKLFMAKIILNMQKVFKAHGKFFIAPILRFLTLHLASYHHVNCVIKDLLIMLIDWRSVAIPADGDEKKLAQNLLELLIKNADSQKSYIHKYNVEMINMLVEAWKSCLEVPQGILCIPNASKKFTVRLILTFIFNTEQKSILNRNEILSYLTNSLSDSDEKMVLDICNGLGYVLNFLESKNDDERKNRIIADVQILLIDKSNENPNKFIKSIYEIHKLYPNIINLCYVQLTYNFSKIDNSNKDKFLELFLSALNRFNDDREIITELGYIKFQDIFKNKILICENAALKIVEKLLDRLNASDYLPFARLTVPYSKDVPVEQREIVMDIFMAVHRKYSANIDDDIAISDLKDLSNRILLLGLLDPNESLAKKLFKFWTENDNMPEKSIERILKLFDMYDVNLESNYLPILPLMMLNLVSKDPGYKKKMFEPLSKCRFEDYQVAIQWRSKHAALAAPLFTSSFATQMSQYYTQSNPTFVRFNQSLNQSLFLRISQPLQIEQTLAKDQSSFQPSGSRAVGFNNPTGHFEKIPQPSKNKKSQRLLQNTTNLRDNIRRKQISKNLRIDEILKEEVDRQRESIKIYRKYRIGDFPDTEITHSNLIEPLQELVKNDQIIARELTVAIFSSMLREMSIDERKEFLEKLSTSLNLILNNSHGSKPLIATVLEIILNSEKITVNPNVIAKVSKSCGLFSLSALLLEEKIISANPTEENPEPVPKKSKLAVQISDNENHWLQLASIYKSMDDFDTVQSIFVCNEFGKELQEASLAQAASKWKTARNAYEKAYEINEGLAKDYCEESLFTCLAYMSDWQRINDRIKTKLDGDFNAPWKKPLNENLIISWTLEAQIQKMVNNDCDDLSQALSDWLNDKEKLIQLKRLYGEEIAVFCIDENPTFSQHCLRSGLEKIINEWKHINPFYYEQKINKYIKLRGLSDIKTYLRCARDNGNKSIENLGCTFNVWNNNVPEKQDNLLLWDKHIAYRLYFFGLLRKRFSNEDEDSEETSQELDMLNDAVVKQCLNVARVAFAQHNIHVMKKYLRYSEQYTKNVHSKLINEWELSSAKCKYLCYETLKGHEKRAKQFIESWKISHELVTDDDIDKKYQIDVRQHIGDLMIELQKLLIKYEPVADMLLKNQLISERLPCFDSRENILKNLSVSCLNRLKECHELADVASKASCYLKISKYCHSMSGHFDKGVDLSEEFVNSTLRAMSYGSREASQYFPCLLNLEYSDNSELSETFKREIEKVEIWMFIKWQAQLFSHIETAICPLIAPVLLRLAETYPNSFIYTYRVTKAINKSLSKNPIVVKLSEILSENRDLELFLKAMNYVVQPELYLIHHINEFKSNIAKGVTSAVNTLVNAVYPTVMDDGEISFKGKIYNNIAKFQGRIKDAEHKESGELIPHMNHIVENLNKSLEKRIRTCKVSLEDYSPWLYNFSKGDIEVPGQYVGDIKPAPEYHTKIVKLDSFVTVLPSLRKPVKITMLGNDGKNYHFLVKFGEDLRLDERIEQLFVLMNKILQGDGTCRQRRLSIDTYLVIPLTGSLGLIQWVDNTRSLNEIFESVLTEDQKIKRQNAGESYLNWINATGQNIESMYKKAVLRYNREDATRKFNDLKIKIDWDVLRQAFKKLSSSPESFFAVRHNFTTSYATMCIAHWILGIGDRNLSNTLISYTSGKALGIDFGYSFDAAVDLPVPELMPFRLTPQIIGFLQPFDENGLLKITMINVLRALKNGQDPLIACMDIFVREPSLDWLARKKATDADRQEDPDARWYPKQKINIVIDKLNGAKPSKLTLLQIKDRYNGTDYFSKYIDIVNGSADGLQSRVRSMHKDDDLSVEEQVECLLDQATDPNILIRTYVGWEPWI